MQNKRGGRSATSFILNHNIESIFKLRKLVAYFSQLNIYSSLLSYQCFFHDLRNIFNGRCCSIIESFLA